jgi:lipopolysaccharide export system permease protein
MGLLDRYIAGAVLKGVATVVFVLLAVVTFVEFVGQLDDVGTAQYDLEDAFAYVALRLPRMIVQMLPAAALLGALFSLGNLATHSELVVMRSSGVSRIRMIGSVGIAGIVLMIFMALLGESLAPSLGNYASQLRSQALLDSVDIANARSAWLKDGDRISALTPPRLTISNAGYWLTTPLRSSRKTVFHLRRNVAPFRITN